MKRKSRHEDIVHHAVRRALKDLEAVEGSVVLDEGEAYVCGFCLQPVKPCESDPRHECKDKILGGTELHGLVTRVQEVTKGFPVSCSMCGRRLAVQEIRKNALSELCPACQAKKRPVKKAGLNRKGRLQ